MNKLPKYFLAGALLLTILNGCAERRANYYRQIDFSGHLFKGKYPLTAELAKKVNCYYFVYDKNNRPVVIEYLKDGKIKNQLPLSSVAKIIINYTGYVQGVSFQDANDNPVPDEKGIYSWRIKIDRNSNQAQTFAYDQTGQLMDTIITGIAESLSVLDNKGRISKIIQLFDKNHSRVINRDGVPYEFRFTYDKQGNVSEISAHKESGELVKDKQGIAIRRIQFDQYGKTIQGSCYGQNNDLTESNEYGAAIVRYKYDDKGNLIETSVYGAYDQPKNGKEGVAIIRYSYDKEGNLIEAVNYDKDNKITEDSKTGTAVTRFSYDAKGNLVENSGYGASNELKGNMDGIAIQRNKYDSKSKVIEASFYGPNNQLVENKDGFAIYKFKYAGEGKILENSFYGQDEKLKEDTNGVAIYKYIYDNKGNLIERSFYGSDGNPTQERKLFGCAVYRTKYDDKGNIIECDYYGINKELISINRYSYDQKGKPLKISHYDSKEELAEGSDGIATRRFKYNDKDGTVEKSCYGANDELKEDKTGVVAVLYKYDEDRKKEAVIKTYTLADKVGRDVTNKIKKEEREKRKEEREKRKEERRKYLSENKDSINQETKQGSGSISQKIFESKGSGLPQELIDELKQYEVGYMSDVGPADMGITLGDFIEKVQQKKTADGENIKVEVIKNKWDITTRVDLGKGRIIEFIFGTDPLHSNTCIIKGCKDENGNVNSWQIAYGVMLSLIESQSRRQFPFTPIYTACANMGYEALIFQKQGLIKDSANIFIPLSGNYLPFEWVGINFINKGLKQIDITTYDVIQEFEQYKTANKKGAYIIFDKNGKMIENQGLFEKSGYINGGFYKYNDQGFLNEFNEGEIVRFEYDDKGNRSKMTVFDVSGQVLEKDLYERKFDNKGNVIAFKETKYHSNPTIEGNAIESINFRYNNKNKVVKEVSTKIFSTLSPGTYTTQKVYEYDSSGNITKIRFDELNNGNPIFQETSYKYNEKNYPVERIETGKNGSSVLVKYTYDDRGNTAKIDIYMAEAKFDKYTWILRRTAVLKYIYE